MDVKSTRYQKGSIDRRDNAKGSVWRYRYRDQTGTAKVLTFDVRQYPTKADVMRATERLRHQINEGTCYSAVESVSVSVALDTWLDSLSGLKHHTVYCYRLSAQRIREQFGNTPLESLKAMQIKTWLESLPVSPSQRAHHRFVVRSMFQHARLTELTDRENPCDLVRLKGTTKRQRTIVILTPDQFKQLVEATRKPFDRLVLVAGMMGLRIGEALALQWGDFNPATGTVSIQRNVSHGHIETPKTKASATRLPVPASLMALILSWKTDQSNEWLFPSARSASGLFHAGILQQKVLVPAAEAIGLPRIGWHALRHSYRSWLDAANVTAGVSKDLMRHADISTTMNVYGRSLPAGMKDAADAIAGMLA